MNKGYADFPFEPLRFRLGLPECMASGSRGALGVRLQQRLSRDVLSAAVHHSKRPAKTAGAEGPIS